MGKKASKRKKQQSNQRGYATTTNAVPKKSAATKIADSNSGSVTKLVTSMQATTLANNGISSQDHQDLLHLLETMDDEEKDHSTVVADTSYITPERFYKKLYNIHYTLDQLGFSFENIQKVVKALKYSITLETALDWLCLHLSTQDLPPIFTEKSVRESEEQEKLPPTSAPSLEVLKPTVVDPNSEPTAAELPVAPHLLVQKKNEAQQETHTSPPHTEQTKDWILQQYQYEGDYDEEEEQDGVDQVDGGYNSLSNSVTEVTTNDSASTPKLQHDKNKTPNKATPTATTASPKATTTTTAAPALLPVVDPNEKRLMEMEEQLRQQEADLNDEASNYMRSKHEIKQLRADTKKLRQQVQGLRKKVEKAKRQAEQEAAAEPEVAAVTLNMKSDNDDNDEDDGMMGGGFFGGGGGGNDDEYEEEERGGGSFFDQPMTSAAKAPIASSKVNQPKEEEKPPPSDPVVPKDSVPSGWTGKTPKQILEDWCKKEKLRVKFFKLNVQNGARVNVETKPVATAMATDNYMGSFRDAQEYLATKVLYHLNPDLPLYRLFPPYHRELWKSWSDSVQSQKEAVKQQESDVIAAKIQQLVDSVPKTTTTKSSSSQKTDRVVLPPATADDEEIRENWEDDNHDDFGNIVAPRQQQKTVDEPKIGGSLTASRQKRAATRLGGEIQKEFQKRQKTPAYQKMLEARRTLPMYAFREQVLQTIQDNPVTILCAETGAGKTTQCPQFILEDAFANGLGDHVSVITTQPRRVAATSVAERVSDEMAEPALGGTVGYQIRLEAKRSSKTKLLFCTTGIILRRLQDDPLLGGITHVCVDEVHERQYQVDCLLVMLRQLLRNGRPDLKVILMSATLDAQLFCSFFGGAPVLNVPGRTFPVAVYHLEDLLEGTGHIIEEGSRYAIRNYNGKGATASVEISTRGGEKRKEVHSLDSGGVHLADVSDDYPEYKVSTRRSMDRVNEEIINYELIEDILLLLLVHPEKNEVLLPPEGASFSDGHVLVFLPGLGEIQALTQILRGSRSLGNRDRFDIIPMHSTLSPQDQRRAFLKPKKGCRKIILATNIAETSVTIPGVVAVVDTGRVREVRVDKRTSTSKLVTDWCSRASAKQRAGRAGRIQPGICLKLYSSRTSSVTMNEAAQPEIRRVPLEDVCLSILAGSFADRCMDFLSQTPQPPAEEAVRSALRILSDVGAITYVEKKDSKNEKTSEQLTALGRHLARLPVDVRLGKMLIFGALFNCIEPVLTVAASLSCKSPFSAFVNDALQAKAKHKAFIHPQSDFLTLCNVWESYQGAMSEGMSKARSFCTENYLGFSALREIGDTRRHFRELLSGIGFIQRSQLNDNGKANRAVASKAVCNANGTNLDVVHSVCCAGLYPNVGHLPPNESGIGERQLWHKNEQLFFHSSSVNSALKTTGRYPTSWIAFHEKFGTGHRVTVSATCFVHPFAVLLFGGDLVVKHTERRVIVDDWIDIPMAAQTGVMFQEVRKQVDRLLQRFLDVETSKGTAPLMKGQQKAMVEGIVRLLSTGTTSS